MWHFHPDLSLVAWVHKSPSSPNDMLFLWKGWTDLKTKGLFRAVVPLSCAESRMGTLGVSTAHPHGQC